MLVSRLNIYFGLITIAVVLPYFLGFSLPPELDGVVLIVFLAITGIPHGAIDHVIFLQQVSLKSRKSGIIKLFFIPYLLLIGATCALWLLIPQFVFWFFLLVAAYHFGQSQLFYIHWTGKSGLKLILYTSWGCFILSSLWFFHWEAQSEIISTFFPWNLASASSLHLFVKCSVLATGLITVSLLALLFKRGQLSGIMLAQELSVLLSLLLLFYFTSPYIAFAIYFGLWHAMRVIFTEYHFLKVKAPASFTSGAFIRSFVPFSLLSFAGLGFLFLLSQWLQASISPFMLFFIFISALTMPHAFFMEKMYRFLGNKLVV